MNLYGRLIDNWQDMQTFGPRILARHFGRLRADRRVQTHLRGIGTMTLRSQASDIACVRQVFRYREYCFGRVPELKARVQREYRRILGSGRQPLIVDGGANIGSASLWFSQQYAESKIVAIEPDDGNFDLLVRNCQPFANIYPMQAALGSEPGFVHVNSRGAAWAVQTERAESGLPVVTIDQISGEHSDSDLFIVKIDIEGFEKDLFASNLEWIKRSYAIFIEPHDWLMPGQFTSSSFMKALAGEPFEVFILGENLAFVRA